MRHFRPIVYPKCRAVELASTNKQPVPSMPTEMAENTTKPTQAVTEPHIVAMKQAPIKAQTPALEEVEITEVFVGLLGLLSLTIAACLPIITNTRKSSIHQWR